MNIGLIPQKWARLTPQKLAVIDAEKNRRISFKELENFVNQIANGLISIGLQKGDRVGIISKNSIEHLALFYACGRIGLIAQPMNWRLSASELTKIIENGNPKVWIETKAEVRVYHMESRPREDNFNKTVLVERIIK